MIHAVFCENIVERAAAIKFYKDHGLQVTWYGPDSLVQPEKVNGQAIAACADCAVPTAAGNDACLVVAYPAGKGPFPG